MLYERINIDMLKARINKDNAKKSILSVLLGEIQLTESRSGTKLSDAEIVKVIKKLKKSCDEVALRGFKESEIESAILNEYLPKTLSIDEIQCIIITSPIYQEILDADNPMKLMSRVQELIKETGQDFNGKDVAIALKQIK